MSAGTIGSGEEVLSLEKAVKREISRLHFNETRKSELVKQMSELKIPLHVTTNPKFKNFSFEDLVKQVLRETFDIDYERRDPAVLVLDTDPTNIHTWKDSLEKKESINVKGFSKVEEFADYVGGRSIDQFFLTGLIVRTNGRDDPQHAPAMLCVDRIKACNKKPLYISIITPEEEIDNRLSLHFDDPNTPRAYQVLYRVIGKFLGFPRLIDTPPQHKVGVLEQQIADLEEEINRLEVGSSAQRQKRLEQNERRHELANLYRMDSSTHSVALSVYEEILGYTPRDARAIQSRAALYLRRPMRASLAEFSWGKLKGAEALIDYIHDRAEKLDLPDADYLIGKAHIVKVLGSENPLQTASRKGRRDVEEAIKFLTRRFHVRAHLFDSQIYLALAYIFRNKRGDISRAYDIISFAQAHSDLMTGQITSDSRFELNVDDRFDVSGSRLEQLTGLHRVFFVCDDAVVKRFERDPSPESKKIVRYERPGEGKRATVEVENIKYLNEHKEALVLRSPRHTKRKRIEKEQIVVPKWSALVVSEKPEEPYMFEVMECIPGVQLAEEFERLDMIDTSSEEDARVVDDKKVEHLEWLVEVGSKLQLATVHDPKLKDTRKIQYGIALDERSIILAGHYTARLFDKIVDVFERIVTPAITLLPREKKKLVGLTQDVERFLLYQTPSEFFWPYTDNNIRNFVIECGLDGRVRVKGRVDFENADKRLWTADALTVTEHELARMRVPPEESKPTRAEYLNYRWLSNLLIGSGAPSCENGQALYETFSREINRLSGVLIWSVRHAGVEGSPGVREVVECYVERAFGFSQLPKLMAYESGFRHLTIIGDKLREQQKIQARIEEFEKKYVEYNLGALQVEGSFRQLYTAMRNPSLLQRTRDFAIRRGYAYFRAQLENVIRYRRHHLEQYVEAQNRISEITKNAADPFLYLARYLDRKYHLRSLK